MAYILRNEAGAVVGVFARPQYDGHELIPDDHPDILARMAANNAAREAEAEQDYERQTLRDLIRAETEADWLARTDAARWKIVLRALKAIEKRI